MRAKTAVLLVVVTLAVTGSTVPLAAADHRTSPTQSNFTLTGESAADHQPGATQASWLSFSSDFSIPSGGFQYLNYTMAMSGVNNKHGVSWANCQPQDVTAYGIDRGNNNSGTTTDTPLLSKTEGTGNKKNRVWGQFFEPGDLAGDTVHLNESDQIVVKWDSCLTVTNDPGWYQASGLLNGTTWSGKFSEGVNNSHYFWVCNCSSEQEAKQKLGPKPSSSGGQQQQGTPSSQSTPTQSTATPQGTPTPTPQATPTPKGTPTPTPQATPTSQGTPTATPGGGQSTPTATPQSGADGTQTTAGGGGGAAAQATSPGTPTTAGGPGFGAVLSIVALLGSALLALRRTG